MEPLREINMGVSGFLGHRNENMRLKEYEIKVLPINSNNSQIDKALYLPKICWSIKGQNLSCTVKNHDFIRNLPLADAIFDSGANIYIIDRCGFILATCQGRSETYQKLQSSWQ